MAFELEFAEIAEEAFELIGLEVRTGYDLMRARRSLNIMLQDWSNQGINLWKMERLQVNLPADADHLVLDDTVIDVIDAVTRYKGRDYSLHRTVRADYLTIPNKDQEGRPTEIYMERTIVPKLYYWPIPLAIDDTDPTPQASEYDLVAYVLLDISTADDNVTNPNVPSRFYDALINGLAFRLARKLAPERMEDALMEYNRSFDAARNEDSERGSMIITPRFC